MIQINSKRESENINKQWIHLGSLLDKARLFYKKNDYERAVEIYSDLSSATLLNKNKKSTVYAELGYCLFYLGKYSLAIEHLQKSLKLHRANPARLKILDYLAQAYESLNQLNKAIQVKKQALRIKQKELKKNQTIFEIGRIYLKMKKYKTAKDYFQKILSQPISNDDSNLVANSKLNLGYTLGYLEGYEETSKFFKLMRRDNDEQIKMYGLFGLCWLNILFDKYSKAHKYSEEFIATFPSAPQRETVLYYQLFSLAGEGKYTELNQALFKFGSEFPQSKYLKELEKLKLSSEK